MNPHSANGRQSPADPLCRKAIDALLVAAGRGDLDAFASFYDRTAPLVFGLLRGVLDEPARAEGATQRVYLQLWRDAPGFDPAGQSAFATLLRTAHRELADR